MEGAARAGWAWSRLARWGQRLSVAELGLRTQLLEIKRMKSWKGQAGHQRIICWGEACVVLQAEREALWSG